MALGQILLERLLGKPEDILTALPAPQAIVLAPLAAQIVSVEAVDDRVQLVVRLCIEVSVLAIVLVVNLDP
jgi:hypothetical protein